MNVKFLFEYIEAQRKEMESDYPFFNDEVYYGYQLALNDLENYLKETIKLTKKENDKLAKSNR